MIIRDVTMADKEAVCRLARMFFDEKLNSVGLVYDQKNAEDHFDAFFGKAIAICAEKDGVVVGIICGIVSAKLFCSGLTCQEMVWFVDPKERSCGVRLIKEFEKVAKDLGCDDILMIGMDGDKSENYYMRSGYQKLQSTYVKRMV